MGVYPPTQRYYRTLTPSPDHTRNRMQTPKIKLNNSIYTPLTCNCKKSAYSDNYKKVINTSLRNFSTKVNS
jgi:hypothetical protein